jgi:primosomal protein N' (replication factor Y) (superfamily II helicase)
VALDVPLARLFDYALPNTVAAAVGDRVVVPFGARQQLGVVLETEAASALPASRMKSIAAVRDDAPRLANEWLELMRFLSSYYQRPLGETIIASLPPRLRSVKPLPRKALDFPKTESSPHFVATHALTSDQDNALRRVAAAAGRFEAFLLHGVTGSGKTEVYLHLIAATIARGGQALVLVPEISLTPQLEERFRQAFPEARIALMHSGLEDIARTAAWLQASRGDAAIVLGTRLAVLAPLPKLALILVDEEHDPSFKQQEGLRYSARHAVARDLAQLALRALRAPGACRARCAGRAPARGTHHRHDTGNGRSGLHGVAPFGSFHSKRARRAKPPFHQPPRLCAGARLRGLWMDRRMRALQRADGPARRR